MKIYLVRHGSDDSKYRGGWSNKTLNKEGVKQAKAVGKYLKGVLEESRNIKIISSDLPRALDTSYYISKSLNVSIKEDERIREINNGDLSGMLNEIAEIKYKGLYFNTLDCKQKYPNGESPEDFYNRISNFFEELIKMQKDTTYIVVTHSGVINIFLHIIKGIKWSNKHKAFKCSHGSVTLLDYSLKKFNIIFENYTDFNK